MMAGNDGSHSGLSDADMLAMPQPAHRWETSGLASECGDCGVSCLDDTANLACPGKPAVEPQPNDKWWARRWIDKATPGELAAMKGLVADA